jgi:hypothetical protein
MTSTPRLAKALPPGSRLGPYEILAPRGAGGMGQVYRARDTRLGRFVALKVLNPPETGDAPRFDRFEREARAIARVNHPHICALHDVGREDGVAFLVMEYLEGETLASRLEGGALPVNRVVEYGAQIADALDAAHRAGVVHRDLKPSNIMLTASGVKVLDFGLAKLRDVDVDPAAVETVRAPITVETEVGTILGTYPYMSPEQVEGRAADARSDIFALGVVLYEMISRRRPFEGRSHAALAAAILAYDPPPLSTHVVPVPPLLDHLVFKCLAKNPEDRWQSARDVASALRWVPADEAPTAARPVEAVSSRPRTRRALLAVGALAALASAVGVWTISARTPTAPPSARPPRFTRVTFRAGTVNGARFAPDGETVIYSASWQAQPYALFMTRRGSPESRPLNVEGVRLLGVSSSDDLAFLRSDHQSLGWSPYRTRIVGRLARVSLTGGAPRDLLDDVFAADWDPVSAELAVAKRATSSGAESLIEFPVGKPIYRSEGRPSWMRIAPQGDRLAFFEDGAVVVLNRAGVKATLSKRWDIVGGLAWSPDGREVWFSAGDSGGGGPSLRAVSMAGRERPLFQTDPGFLVLLDVFRDGRALVARHDSRFTFTCVTPESPQGRDLGWLDVSTPEALSRDGRTVVFGESMSAAGVTGSVAAYLRKTDGSDAIRLGEGYPEDLSPDGKWVLIGRRGRTSQWTIMPTGAGSPISPAGGPFDWLGEANFLPDGHRFVFGGRERGKQFRVYVQDIQGQSAQPISPEHVFTNGLSTPDGRFVLGSIGGNHFLYPVTGGPPRPIPFLSAEDDPLQWSPDGRSLYVRNRDSWPPRIDRVDVVTGQRQTWKTIFPSDGAGIDSIFRILLTPDATSYCYDHLHFLSTLYVVEGLN